MYRVGVVSDSGVKHDFLTLSQKEKEWEIIPLETYEDPEIKELDAVYIEEGDTTRIGFTCDWIIKLREQSSAFLWVLTKQELPSNRRVYLALGADGVFDHQTDKEELQLMTYNLVQRFRETKRKADGSILNSEPQGDILLDQRNSSVILPGGKSFTLTKLEMRIMRELYDHRGSVVTYEELFHVAWGSNGNTQRSKYRVANLVCHLRQKIDENVHSPQYIETIRSKGYRLR